MEQVFDKTRQNAAIIREFVDSWEDAPYFALRVWEANPDLREQLHRANSAAISARYEAAGGIKRYIG